MKTLPNESKMRYRYPISSGCLAYFPAAIAGVAKHSYIGGAKYNDGALVHLRYISTEHLDCIGRHLLDLQDLIAAKGRGITEVETYVYDFETKQDVLQMLPIDEAILIECNALSWRSLAFSQEQHEKTGTPVAPAARTTPLPTPYNPITLLDFGRNKVAVVKAIREVADYSLREAIDAIDERPSLIRYNTAWSREKAIQRLVEAGATVK